jgi:hypothetical protein
MKRYLFAIFGAAALLLGPGTLWAQDNPDPDCSKIQLSDCGKIFKAGMIEEQKLKKDFEDNLTAIRNSSASDSDKQAQIFKATKDYQQESTELVVKYREPVLKVINELANETGVITAQDGTNITDQSGPSTPILPSTGTKPSDEGYRGMASDTDSMGGSKTIDKIPGILNQMGLTDLDVKETAGYTSVDGLNVTYHKPNSAIGSAIGPVGSSAYETQVAVDAKSKETYVSESMSQGQPGKTYVEVMDHTKKANEGLKADPITLLNDTNEVLQTLAKGTMKAGNSLYGKENMDAKLAEILKSGNVQIPGIPPEQFGDLLVKLKTGSSVAPDGVGITQDNIVAFQTACKTVLDQIQAEAKQKADTEMQQIDAEIKVKEATGDPVDKTEAQKLREKKVDSKVKIGQSEKFNKPYEKPVEEPGETPTKSGVIAGDDGDSPAGQPAKSSGTSGEGPSKAGKPAGDEGRDVAVQKTPDSDGATGETGKPQGKPDSETVKTPVKKGTSAEDESSDVAGKKKPAGDAAGDKDSVAAMPGIPKPDVTVKFFEKFFSKEGAVSQEIKSGGMIGPDGVVGSAKVETQLGHVAGKSYTELSSGEGGFKAMTSLDLEIDAAKIQTMTTLGNETVTGTVINEAKIGANAGANAALYMGSDGAGFASAAEVFAGAKVGTSGSLLLDLKQWIGVSAEGQLQAEAGVGVGAKGVFGMELSWGGIKTKGGASSYAGVGGGVSSAVNIDASPLVFGVDLAKADQDLAKSDILQSVLLMVKNGVIQLPEGKTFSDIAGELDQVSAAVVKQPDLLPRDKDGKPAISPAAYVVNKVGFKPPAPPVPAAKPPLPDPKITAFKAAEEKQQAWEKAVLGGKLKPDEYAKFEAGYSPAQGIYKTPKDWKDPSANKTKDTENTDEKSGTQPTALKSTVLQLPSVYGTEGEKQEYNQPLYRATRTFFVNAIPFLESRKA